MPERRPSETQPNHTVFGIIDLATVNSAYPEDDDYTELLLNRLKQDKVYRKGLLFTGIYDVDETTVKKYGADSSNRKTTFAHTEDELFSRESTTTIWEYAYMGDNNKMILIYDGSKLESDLINEYTFSDGVKPINALVAAYTIREN
jgi:hypothetical protein